MEIDIDIDKIVGEMNIKELIEKRVESEIVDSSKLEDAVNGILEDEDMKHIIHKKIFNIIEEYLSSNEGKNNIIKKFEQAIDDYDILTDDRIIELLAEFFKKALAGKH